jgi:hypothetical protein
VRVIDIRRSDQNEARTNTILLEQPGSRDEVLYPLFLEHPAGQNYASFADGLRIWKERVETYSGPANEADINGCKHTS